MSTFTIETDNNITAFATLAEAMAQAVEDSVHFDTQAALARASVEWPMSRFVEIWNRLAGQTPVKKFTDRKTAATRIWKAIQSLGGNGLASEPNNLIKTKGNDTPVADQPTVEDQTNETSGGEAEVHEASEAKHPRNESQPTEPFTPADSLETTEAPPATDPKGKRKTAKGVKTSAAKNPSKAAKPAADRANKKAEVIATMKRAKGATLAEIMEATDWQRHTVRGFVSLLGSKGGLAIESSKSSAGERSYRIAK